MSKANHLYGAGKGDRYRRLQKSTEINDLRFELAFGDPKAKEIARKRLVELGDLKKC